MIHRSLSLLVFLSSLFITANGFCEQSADIPVSIESLSNLTTDENFKQHGYYTFRRDLRLCPAPLCGGIFVKTVNRLRTRCANGRLRAECYVALVKNRNNLDIDAAALIRGRIKPKIYPGIGNLGKFELKEAFRSATDRAGNGNFVGLQNNGLVCITSPCFSYFQYRLNRNRIRLISGVDFEETGAPAKDLQAAFEILGNQGVLIAAGSNRAVEELAGTGITFFANQIYFPIKATIDSSLNPSEMLVK